MQPDPKVAVLMASYNGAEWIAPQLQSILDCEGVTTHIFLSDDGSTDGTVQIAQDICGDRLTLLPEKHQRSAAQNFIRLVLDAPWDGFNYVCLADQDDIWSPDKLARAVTVLEEKGVAAYSSDITAFWPDGRRQYIRKSQPQRLWDHLFESAGPGNTFVWPMSQADFLRAFLKKADPKIRGQIAFHDWAFFAIFREAGKSWHIDTRSGLEYRQHGENVIGVAKGLKAVSKRVGLMRNGWYRRQVLCLAALTEADNPVIDYMRAPRLGRALAAAMRARQCRRRAADAAVLAVMLCLMAFYRKQK